jgi:S-DNA-T family DNA segregation ATPase FtsK/SpoIIIE
MPDPVPARWRLDAVALTAFAAAAALGTALATHPPLAGLEPPFGSEVDQLAGQIASALGFAAFVGLTGWVVVAGLYVAHRGWGRLAVRALGWLVLTGCAAAAADFAGAALGRSGSAFGPGGSIGAFLRLSPGTALSPTAAWAAFAAAALLGLLLAADGLVRWIARRIVGLARAGNRLVEAGSNRVIAVVGAVRLRRTKPAVEEVSLAPVSALESSEPIPIIVHNAPPELRLVTGDEEAPLHYGKGSHGGGSHGEGSPEPVPYELPPLTLLADPDAFPVEDHESALRERAALLEKTFQDFGLNVKVVGIHTGPVITQYEVALETGLRLNKVTNLADDLSLNLRVPAVRVVAPLPGRNTVGIEVPNEHRQTVRLKELITATQPKAAKSKLPVFLGKDVEGRPLVYDLAAMPHLLIAGRTGTGKSVCLNAIILSLLYTRQPDECRMIMIDPKKVELSEYGKVPHLMHPVVTDDKKAEAILAWAVDKMEERYEWLRRARVRNIAAFNDLGTDEVLRRIDPESEDERQQVPRRMPYIVIVIDEVGDLIMSMKKEVESHIIRLAQKARAAGIHVILATQKPTVDVITGLIKSNLPARICFQVASRADSMVVLDEKGADKLLGQGDMLFLQPGTSTIVRAQGAYVEDQEIERTVSHLETDEPNYESELLNLKAKDTAAGGGNLGEKLRERDPLYEQAIEIVIREQRGSTSLLQRALGIGYGRASRLIDFMAEDGIVGAFNGSNARDVLVTPEEWESRRSAAG